MEDLANQLAKQIPLILDGVVALLETRVEIHPPIWMLVVWGMIWGLSVAYARLDALSGHK